MPAKSQDPSAPTRRAPRQARSRETVGLMLEATARIIEREGLERLTTNRVAEVAGVSVGTLYQYFDDKHALLRALARRELDGVRERMATVLRTHDDPRERARRGVRLALEAFGGRHRVRKLVLQAVPAHDPEGGLAATADAFARLLAGDGRRDPVRAFVLVHAVIGAIRGALLQDERLLASPAFEQALVDLVQGFSRADG